MDNSDKNQKLSDKKTNTITLKCAEKSKDVNEEINKQDIKSGKKIFLQKIRQIF